jgi:hypothetical protein
LLHSGVLLGMLSWQSIFIVYNDLGIHPEALPREFYWHFGNRQWPSVLTL